MPRKKISYRMWKKVLKLMPTIAVDGVLIEDGKVLLVKRAQPPFVGYWITPGGFVDFGERLAEACEREFGEETGIRAKAVKLVGIYDDPKRDPRGHVIAIAYLLKRKSGKIKISEESLDARFFPARALPKKLCSSVRQMVGDALRITARQ